MPRLASAALLALLLLFTACDTDPPSDVTYKSATLHGQAKCSYGTYTSWVQFQLRPAGGAWADVGARHPFSCAEAPGSETADISEPVAGLRLGTAYEYRLAAEDGHTYDADGTQDGTNYERFTTATFTTVTPRSADSIRKTIGINTRLAYQGTPHANCAQVKAEVQYLGVAETRDGLWPEYDNQWDCLRDLAANTDVKFVFGLGDLRAATTLTSCDPPPAGNPVAPTAAEAADGFCADGNHDVRTFNPNKPGNGDQCLNCKVADLLKPANAQIAAHIVAFENVNEPDNYTPYVNWPANAKSYQQYLWNTVRPQFPGVQVLGPTFALGGAEEFTQGELNPWMDECETHPYPGPGVPPASIFNNDWQCDGYAQGKPEGITEMGWHQELCGVDQDNDGNNAEAGECRYNKGVNAAVQASYTLRGILENYRLGVGRTDWYTIVEQTGNPINNGVLTTADWGWHTSLWTRKPVADAVHNFTTTIGTGSDVTPLPYRVDSVTADTRSFVFRRADGKYVVALWRTGSQWNEGAAGSPGTPASVSPVAWSATIPDAANVTYLVPTTGQAGAVSKNDDQYTMILGGDPVLLVVTPG